MNGWPFTLKVDRQGQCLLGSKWFASLDLGVVHHVPALNRTGREGSKTWKFLLDKLDEFRCWNTCSMSIHEWSKLIIFERKRVGVWSAIVCLHQKYATRDIEGVHVSCFSAIRALWATWCSQNPSSKCPVLLSSIFHQTHIQSIQNPRKFQTLWLQLCQKSC